MAQESWNREEETAGCEPPQGPLLCANNCGFFGSKTTMNLCSKCYRDIVLEQQQKQKIQLAIQQPQSSSPAAAGADWLQKSTTVEAFAGGKEADQVKLTPGSSSGQERQDRPKNRCLMCDKRLGLTGFKCRCGDFFCALHRYSDKHNCSFDYKSVAREAISKANPIVKASKLDKI